MLADELHSECVARVTRENESARLLREHARDQRNAMEQDAHVFAMLRENLFWADQAYYSGAPCAVHDEFHCDKCRPN